MSLLRKTRAEMAGAWRSLRYDLGRRPAEPPADGPDVTSTGMNTFGGLTSYTQAPYPQAPAVPARRPGRAVAAGAFGVLTVVGATAAYLGVVNGLGSLTPEQPAAADTFPARPAATSEARVGPGPAAPSRETARRTAATPTPAAAMVRPDEAAQAADAPAAASVRKIAPQAKKEIRVSCPCGGTSSRPAPPVPTPTAPTSAPSPTPSASDSPNPSPSESSATPDDSAEPSESPQVRHRRRQH